MCSTTKYTHTSSRPTLKHLEVKVTNQNYKRVIVNMQFAFKNRDLKNVIAFVSFYNKMSE